MIISYGIYSDSVKPCYAYLFDMLIIITLPTGVVAKYCDEYVCLCICLSVCLFVSVCLSARMSLEPHARSLRNFLCMLPMSVARSSSGMLTIGHIAY